MLPLALTIFSGSMVVVERKRDRSRGPGFLLIVLLGGLFGHDGRLGFLRSRFGAGGWRALSGRWRVFGSVFLRCGRLRFSFGGGVGFAFGGRRLVVGFVRHKVLDFAGFGVGVALHADCLAGALAGSGVGRGALATDGQSAPVADAAITVDCLEALEIALNFAAKVAFDDNLERIDCSE